MSNEHPPPHPDLVRMPTQRFGWIDARMLHDGWFAKLGADAVAVMSLLAIAADRRGASFYNRERMAKELSMNVDQIDTALERLQQLSLVALNPWKRGAENGVWQLLPVPARERPPQGMATLKQALSELAKEI